MWICFNSVPLTEYLLLCFPPEAVTGVVGRADVEACLFFIASFLAYIKSHKAATNTSLYRHNNTRWPWLLLCFVTCVASMLSKEQGITVLGVCAVYEVMVLFSSSKKQTVYVTLNEVSVWYLDKPLYGIYINLLCQSMESMLVESTLKSPIMQRT